MELIIVLIITILTLFLFVSGKLRYDFVALGMVVLLVLFKIITPDEAFLGFSNPAIITIASVLIISFALVKTNVLDNIVKLVNKGPKNISFKIMVLMSITAFLSSFMNNVGALAVMMPITLKIAKDNKIEASKLLMPISFASLLGGMMTTIGTPPNLIVSNYRKEVLGSGFSFFAFFPVSILVTLFGILFVSFIGYKLIPSRKGEKSISFNIEDYLFELRVGNLGDNKFILLKDFANTYNININIVSITRKDRIIVSPGGSNKIYSNDILIVKSMPNNLNDLISKAPLSLVGAKTEKLISKTALKSDDIALVEVVLRDDSNLIGRTAVETKLRNRFNANLVAVSRRGNYQVDRLKKLKFNSGDILLLQAPKDNLVEMYNKMRALPISEQGNLINIKRDKRSEILTVSLFFTAIILTVLNIIPVHISFLSVALLLVGFKVISPREFYDAIEWPSIIMIASLFSLGLALDKSGASNYIANIIINISSRVSPNYILVIIILITIILTNIINNTAATILIAPIAVSIATSLNLNVETFLVGIVVGAAMSFITPISHQSNTLVMGPGGYKFGDYYKMGIPLIILSLIIAVPIILLIWPL